MKKHIQLRRKIYYPIWILSICTSLAIIWFSNTKHQLTVQEVTTSNDIQISLNPSLLNMKSGEEKVVTVAIDTKNHAVSSSVIDLTFNPKLLTVAQLTKGSFFGNRIAPSEVKDGRIIISYGVSSSVADSKTGAGDIISIKFKALSDGEGAIDFGENTEIIPPESSEATDVNVIAIPASYKIGDSVKEITPTASNATISSPSPTATTTPSATPLASPTIKPTPKPTSTPKPKITPSPTPISSPRVYIPLTNTAFDQSKADYPHDKYLTDPSLISDLNQTDSLASPETKPSLFDMVGQFFTRLFKPN